MVIFLLQERKGGSAYAVVGGYQNGAEAVNNFVFLLNRSYLGNA